MCHHITDCCNSKCSIGFHRKKPLACPEPGCSYRFTTKSTLSRHSADHRLDQSKKPKKRHTAQNDTSSLVDSTVPTTVVSVTSVASVTASVATLASFVCEFCSFRGAVKAVLMQHIKDNHMAVRYPVSNRAPHGSANGTDIGTTEMASSVAASASLIHGTLSHPTSCADASTVSPDSIAWR